MLERFPPRPVPAVVAATAADRFTVARRLLAAAVRRRRRQGPALAQAVHAEDPGLAGAAPGRDVAGTLGRLRRRGRRPAADWRDQVLADLQAAGRLGPRGTGLHHRLGTGHGPADRRRRHPPGPGLAAGDRLPRPGSPTRWAGLRDPAGIAALRELRKPAPSGTSTFDPAVERIAVIMAAKGGLVADITPGDCIELLDCCRQAFTGDGTSASRHSPFFYQLLHAAGAFPPAAPATVRMISTQFAGQLTAEQLVDRYDLACRPVRDLLVDYLRERQPGIDYNTLVKLATALVLCFWKDLEAHHPGISSLHLPPDVAAAWKKRLRTRTVRTPGGGEQAVARESADDILMTVRAFYLDLAQWALDDPARWGPWAVPCPIRGSDIQYKKQKSRTKARMDARTRERLPVLPALAAAVDRAPQGRRRPAGRRPRRRARRAVHRRRAGSCAGPAWPGPPAASGPRTPAPASAAT